MAYQEVSTKYPSMINSFAFPDTVDKLFPDTVDKLFTVLPEVTKIPEPVPVKKHEPAPVKKPEPAPVKKPDPVPVKKPDLVPVKEPNILTPPSEELLKKMIALVKPIKSIIEHKSMWNYQKEKDGYLQHQCDSHRAYLYDHKLTNFNQKQNNVNIKIDRIHGKNYFNFIHKNKDITNTYQDICSCNEYEVMKKCNTCKTLRKGIASRSIGQKYDDLNLPKWNLTFKAGGLRSENRVYYGTYTARAKSKLNSNCNSFITFSMMLPIKDAKFPKLGYWEEIAIGFNSKNSNTISLFIKSSLSTTTKSQVVIPIEVKPKANGNKFNVKEYNTYTLIWKKTSISLSINNREVYSTKPNHPIPQLPGYSYFIIRPNYNTDSVELIKNIKKELRPNIYIKSFSYTPLL